VRLVSKYFKFGNWFLVWLCHGRIGLRQ